MGLALASLGLKRSALSNAGMNLVFASRVISKQLPWLYHDRPASTAMCAVLGVHLERLVVDHPCSQLSLD